MPTCTGGSGSACEVTAWINCRVRPSLGSSPSGTRFAPPMWAPIANNVVSIGVLAGYLAVFGHAVDVVAHPGMHPAPADSVLGPFTAGQELLLGLGSTIGIAVQLLVLLPYLRAAGFRYRPRFDFRGSGLGHTLRLGWWTVLFVVVNQIAYTVVVRLASSGTAGTHGCAAGGTHGTGYTVYSNAYLLIIAPHSVITVSLAMLFSPLIYLVSDQLDLHFAWNGLMTWLAPGMISP